MIELLAPAGDLKSFYSAISSGANAVYLGMSNFNARLKAENFNEENIREVIRYAHFYGVKVYITVNTIVKDSELGRLLQMVKVAYLAHADAFLVQDMGVLKVLKEAFPDITLHASTQMGIHNLYGAKIAEKLGIKRVVLSRETKLEDIKLIKKETNLEIEYFIQGALCIAFSGNCYLSSKEQRCSGNRGECKQLCRLPYETMVDGKCKKGFLLSARDLSLKDSLEDLIAAGVSSFKIEGRMRREGYVSEVVSVYRQILDEIENGNPKSNVDGLLLKKAFNRGEYLSRAYLDDKTINVIEPKYNNHIGVNIGKILSVKPFKEDLYEVVVSSTHKLIKGDGLKMFIDGNEVASLGLGDAQEISNGRYKFITKTKCQKDWDVNLTLDYAEEEFYLNKKRLLSVDFVVNAIQNDNLKMLVKYNDYEVELEGDLIEEAKNAPLTKDDIINQISKIQDDGFVLNKAEINIGNVFIPKSKINALRRDVISALKEKIILSNEQWETRVNEISLEQEYINKKVIKEYALINEKELTSSINVILSPTIYSVKSVKTIIDNYDLDGTNIVLQLPIIANHKDLEVIDNILKEIPSINTLLIENMYGLYYADKGYKIIAGEGLNIANSKSVEALKEFGVDEFSLSKEYFVKDELENINVENIAIIENEIPLMTFSNCFVQTIFGGDCSKCKYNGDISIKRESHYYVIKRIVISRCYFRLFSKDSNKKTIFYIDK